MMRERSRICKRSAEAEPAASDIGGGEVAIVCGEAAFCFCCSKCAFGFPKSAKRSSSLAAALASLSETSPSTTALPNLVVFFFL